MNWQHLTEVWELKTEKRHVKQTSLPVKSVYRCKIKQLYFVQCLFSTTPCITGNSGNGKGVFADLGKMPLTVVCLEPWEGGGVTKKLHAFFL